MAIKVEKIYPPWVYQMLIPILLGFIITKLDKIEENQLLQAVNLAQFEIRLSHLERYHPVPIPPQTPQTIPKHAYKPLDQRNLRPKDKL